MTSWQIGGMAESLSLKGMINICESAGKINQLLFKVGLGSSLNNKINRFVKYNAPVYMFHSCKYVASILI